MRRLNHFKSGFRSFLAAIVILSGGGTALHAQDDVMNEVVLTVSGPQDSRTFTRRDLEQIGVSTIRTHTIWTEGVQIFSGPSLAAFAADLDLDRGALRAIAVNDYEVDIPLSDAVEGGPIIAFQQNGEIMSLRENGPLWIVYPYDDNLGYQTETIYARSIWQLERIVVLDPAEDEE